MGAGCPKGPTALPVFGASASFLAMSISTAASLSRTGGRRMPFAEGFPFKNGPHVRTQWPFPPSGAPPPCGDHLGCLYQHDFPRRLVGDSAAIPTPALAPSTRQKKQGGRLQDPPPFDVMVALLPSLVKG